MDTFNHISLYIKRADLYCTKDFIMNVFGVYNIGIVKDVKFIKKTDSLGREYNGAIVIFERWFMNAKVTNLLDNMTSSSDGTAKFIYDYHGRYWYVNVYKHIQPECEAIALIDQSLPDKQRIIELENLTQSMAAQLHYMQLRQERTERQLMEIEEKESHHALCNLELRFKLEDKDMQMAWIEQDNERALKEVEDEITIIRCRLGCMAIDLVRKDEELKRLSYSPLTSEMNVDEFA